VRCPFHRSWWRWRSRSSSAKNKPFSFGWLCCTIIAAEWSTEAVPPKNRTIVFVLFCSKDVVNERRRGIVRFPSIRFYDKYEVYVVFIFLIGGRKWRRVTEENCHLDKGSSHFWERKFLKSCILDFDVRDDSVVRREIASSYFH